MKRPRACVLKSNLKQKQQHHKVKQERGTKDFYEPCWYNKGCEYYKSEQFQKALQCFDKAIQSNPPKEALQKAYHNKGASLHTLSQYKEAIKCYDQAIEIEADEDCYINKGHSLYELKKWEKAMECYNQALSLNSRQHYALCEKGNALMELERPKEALVCYKQVLKIDKTYKDAWNNQGNAFFELGKYEEALECYCQSLLIDAKDDVGLFNIGNTLNNLGRNDEAKKYFSISSKVTKVDFKIDYRDDLMILLKAVWINKGIALYQSMDFRKSSKCFEKVLRVDDKDKDVWNWKGRSLCKMEKYSEAVLCFRKSVELDRKCAITWFYSGKAFCALNSFTRGLKCFDKALKIDQNLIKAHKAKIQVENGARLMFYYEDDDYNHLQLKIPTSSKLPLKAAVQRGLVEFNKDYWRNHKSEWKQSYKDYKEAGGTMTYPEHVSLQLFTIIHPHFKLYSDLNKSLLSMDSSHWTDYLAYLQPAISKLNTFQENRELYRAIPQKLISKYPEKYCAQQMITWSALYSATPSMNKAMDLIKFGTLFVLSNCSACPLLDEDEVLIPRGSTFKITKIVKGEPIQFIYLNLIQ